MRVLVVLVLGLTVTAGGLSAQDQLFRVLADQVLPGSFEPGEVVVRRITVQAQDGVALSYPTALPAGEASEPSRSVQLHRWAMDGGVRWVLSYPFTAWAEGVSATEAVTIEARGRGMHASLTLQGVAFRVDSPLPRARVLQPAPAMDPWPVTLPARALLPLLPLTLVLVSGYFWRRASGVPLEGASVLPTHAVEPVPSLAQVLMDEALSGPEFAVAVSLAVRGHPALAEAGVGPWHTTPEIRETLEWKGRGEHAAAVQPLLQAGDEATYAGRLAADVDLRALGYEALEVLGDG